MPRIRNVSGKDFDQKQNQIIVRFGARVKESGKLDMSLVPNTLWNTEGQDLKILKS